MNETNRHFDPSHEMLEVELIEASAAQMPIKLDPDTEVAVATIGRHRVKLQIIINTLGTVILQYPGSFVPDLIVAKRDLTTGRMHMGKLLGTLGQPSPYTEEDFKPADYSKDEIDLGFLPLHLKLKVLRGTIGELNQEYHSFAKDLKTSYQGRLYADAAFIKLTEARNWIGMAYAAVLNQQRVVQTV